MIFLIFAIISLILPWFRQYGILPMTTLLLCLPVGNAMSIYFYKGGLFFFDFYFLAIFVRFLIEGRLAGKWGIFGAVLVFVWSLIALADGVPLDLHFLRDFRLILYLITLICFATLQSRDVIFTGQHIKWLAAISGASCLLYGLMTAAGVFQFDDEFYVRNSFRYFAVSSYFCFGFFAFSSFLPASDRRGPLFILALSASMVGIALTGFRVMSFVALMLFIIGGMKSARGVVLSVGLLFLGAPLVFLTQGAGDEGANALSRLGEFSPEIVLYQIQTRFSPFFVELSKFEPIEFWVGGGFGQTFEIPWFAHREAKDNLNNYVDSTYLTIYGKFGVISAVMMMVYALCYSRILKPNGRGAVFLVVIGLSLLWAVYSIPYQMASIGLALPLFFIGSARRVPSAAQKFQTR